MITHVNVEVNTVKSTGMGDEQKSNGEIFSSGLCRFPADYKTVLFARLLYIYYQKTG